VGFDPEDDGQAAKDLSEPIISNDVDSIREPRSVDGAELRDVHDAGLWKPGLSLPEPEVASSRRRVTAAWRRARTAKRRMRVM
jgi:hypothetical protein